MIVQVHLSQNDVELYGEYTARLLAVRYGQGWSTGVTWAAGELEELACYDADGKLGSGKDVVQSALVCLHQPITQEV